MSTGDCFHHNRRSGPMKGNSGHNLCQGQGCFWAKCSYPIFPLIYLFYSDYLQRSLFTPLLLELRWVYIRETRVSDMEVFIQGKESENESHSVMSNSFNPMDCSPWNSPGQNTGVGSLSFQSSQTRDQTQVSRIAGRFFTSCVTREAQEYWSEYPIPSPTDLPNPGIKCRSLLHCRRILYQLGYLGNPKLSFTREKKDRKKVVFKKLSFIREKKEKCKWESSPVINNR